MAKNQTEKKGSAKLVILDSHAIIHRAYHALPDFTSSKGEPTGALYGLTTMLLKSLQDLKPDYIIAARDRAEKTHRHEVYENYKATRAKTDDALVEQLIKSEEVFRAFGIPVYDAAGYEADDVVGTIAKQLSKHKGLEIIVVTGDMDLLQLINDNVEVYRLLTGITNMKFYDEAAVRERYGFGPEFIPDLKGIMGDASDNIKGVPGVGEGSAMKLIQTFGGIDDIYKALKKEGAEAVAKKAGIQKRYAELMAHHEDAARFSRELATISTDAPINFSLPQEPWKLEAHARDIAAFCDAFEFRSIKERVASLAGHESEAPAEVSAAASVDGEQLRETSVALWLLHSDTTSPTLEDILQYANTQDFTAAHDKIFSELKKTGRLQEVFDDIEKPLIPVVQKMNATGIFLDTKHLQELAREYNKELGAIAARVYGAAGREFNINSPKQLGTVLFDELQISSGGKQKMTATGARTTREEELQKMAEGNPIVADVLAYRELQKLLGTYIEKMPALVGQDSRLRATFLQSGTVTGRMGCENPNLQNIPVKSEYGRRIREAFAAPKGSVLASLDYSQIELRIAAGLSGDKHLVEIFKNGEDVHAATASRVFDVPKEQVDYEMRRKAKVINFGILYGMGVNALRSNLGAGTTRDEAATFLDQYFKNFSGVAAFVEEQKKLARQKGYTETLFGRRRYFPGINSPLPGIVAQAERMAVNAPMQGTQADIIKLAMVEADTLVEKSGWRERAKLLMQVHDELVYELDEKEAETMARELCKVMESVVPASKLSGVPIVAEIKMGKNWGDAKRIER